MKRIFIICFLTAFYAAGMSAQISLTELLKGKVTVNNKVEISHEAVKPELFIIRQQYRLERNGEYYGKNNKPFYGETYSLAVKVSGGMMFLDDVVEPWKNDADYKRVNATGKYKPVRFWTYQRAITDSVYKAVDLELGTEYVTPFNAQKTLYTHIEEKGNFGLSIDKETGVKAGYMIWAYSKSDIQDSAMVVELRQSMDSIDVKPDSTLIPMSPTDPKKIIGGIFVTPKYGHAGSVQFVLTGIAVRTDNSGWALQMLMSSSAPTDIEVTVSDGDSPEDKRTSKKKRHKTQE